MDTRFTSRKFLLTVAGVMVLAAFRWWDKVTPEQFVDGLKWIIGLYAAGNVAEKATTKTSGITLP